MKRKLAEILSKMDKSQLIDCLSSKLGDLKVEEPKIEKEQKNQKEQKNRKNVDYQWSEYIVYLVCKGSDLITTFEEFEKTFDPLIEKGYLTDLLNADKKKVMKYYNTFYNLFHKLDLKVEKVFLLGKNQSKFPEIKEIHKNLKNVKFKADIIVKIDNGVKTTNSFVGFSVKSSEQDTLTNYSIYKMLELEDVTLLKEIQLNIIKQNNLSVMKSVYKQNREKYNKLFANSTKIDNEYHITLNELILENKESILQQWYQNLFGDLPYNLYTFNGTTLINDKVSPEFIDILPIQNPAKKENVHAAKLFYAIYEKEGDSVPIYKWEIRWKGDIFVSPQILTFKWNPEKDHLKIIKAKK